MATEADLIQKFKDLNIPVGADFEELIHEAFIGANLVEQVNSKADDSKVVHKTGAEGISGQKMFDVAPIDKTTGNPYITRDGVPTIDLSNYPTKDQLATKADDSKVAHLSGANNFDTVPTVNNNPLLLASSLPSTLADTTKLSNFTAGLQSNGTAVATKSDVTTAISTATANMVDSTKATNFTAGLQSGGVNVATAADIKSIEDQAWRPIISNNYSGLCVMKYNADTETMSLSGTIFPKAYSKEGSSVAVIIPMPDGFSMGKNTNTKTNIWLSESVNSLAGDLVDLNFENDGIHIIFYESYTNYKTFIILDGFFDSSISDAKSNSFINFKVTKN